MATISQELIIDPPIICSEIEELIRSSLDNLGRDGAIIGLSGGLDSAVSATMAIRSLGGDKVHLLNMPDQDSKNIHRAHARQLTEHLMNHRRRCDGALL